MHAREQEDLQRELDEPPELNERVPLSEFSMLFAIQGVVVGIDARPTLLRSARACVGLRKPSENLVVQLAGLMELNMVHPHMCRRMGDFLEASGRHFARQRDGEYGRDITVDVLPWTPDVRETSSTPKSDLTLCHCHRRFTDRGNGLLGRTTDGKTFGEPREEIFRAS